MYTLHRATGPRGNDGNEKKMESREPGVLEYIRFNFNSKD